MPFFRSDLPAATPLYKHSPIEAWHIIEYTKLWEHGIFFQYVRFFALYIWIEHKWTNKTPTPS